MPSSLPPPLCPARPASILRPLPLACLVAALLAVLQPATRGLHAQEVAPHADSATARLARTVTLVGVVRDSGGRPLSGAEVRAGATEYAISGADGRFELTGVEPDTIQLLVRRIGYLPAEVVLEAAAGLRVELAVKLVPVALELGTIVVEGKRMSTRLMNNGFYDRQKQGFGKLLGPEELDRTSATLSGIMHSVPGVLVDRGRSNLPIAYGRSGTDLCPLDVFIDGVLIRFAGELGLDGLLNRNDILAVEVYPRATLVPASLSGRGNMVNLGGTSVASPTPVLAGGAGQGMDRISRCGALVLWTKPFDEAQKRRAGRRRG